MAVHKIKAKDDRVEKQPKATPPAKSKKPTTKPKSTKADKPAKQHNALIRFLLWLTTPFRALGRYFRDSWRELRLVQWPTRKFTWKMTLSVIGYVALFALLIGVLDLLFTLLFSNIIK